MGKELRKMGTKTAYLERNIITFKEKKRILFVVYGGGHVNMILPVVKRLMQKSSVDVEVFALTTARKVLEQEGIPCFSCRDLPISAGALQHGEILLKQMNSGHPDIPDEESMAYLGLSFECLVEEYGEKKAFCLYKENGRQSFLPVRLMENILRQGGYHLVVATNSPRMERAAIVAAGNAGVASVCLIDLFALQEVAWIGERGYADKVCVLTDSVKRMLCDAGRLKGEVVVTGNPVFDRLANPDIRHEGQLLRKQKGWAGKKVVLWCSQPEPEKHPFTGEKGEPRLPLIIEEKLKEICDRHHDESWHLVVRPHPSEDMNQRQCLKNVEYDAKENLHPLLAAVDVVVVMSSTVGLEAVLLSKPLVSLDMSIFSKDMPFSTMGLSVGVSDLGGLEDAVMNVFKGDFDRGNKLAPVGGATKNVCDVVMSTLSDL
ncbi:MAG: hypothetical protein Q9N62_13635 [Ghiorsea sp.]|nr:hypothetical protein [Ghiorsea sp.]